MTDPSELIRGADDAGRRMRRMRRQGNWYPRWVCLFGIFAVAQVALVPVLRGAWQTGFLGLALLALGAFATWRVREPVRAVSDMRITVWVLIWFVLSQIVVWYAGPHWAGNNVGGWALLGLVAALPAFIEAILWAKRTR